MRISTKGRYALRIMADISVNAKSGFIALKEISERQDISDKYSEQIINHLVKAGLVRSARGAKGGYMLAMPANQITAGMVLRTMEGSLSPVACLDEDNSCQRANVCPTIDLWKKLDIAISEVVDNYTLEQIAENYIERAGCEYYI